MAITMTDRDNSLEELLLPTQISILSFIVVVRNRSLHINQLMLLIYEILYLLLWSLRIKHQVLLPNQILYSHSKQACQPQQLTKVEGLKPFFHRPMP